jgi:hypothetical protein
MRNGSGRRALLGGSAAFMTGRHGEQQPRASSASVWQPSSWPTGSAPGRWPRRCRRWWSLTGHRQHLRRLSGRPDSPRQLSCSPMHWQSSSLRGRSWRHRRSPSLRSLSLPRRPLPPHSPSCPVSPPPRLVRRLVAEVLLGPIGVGIALWSAGVRGAALVALIVVALPVLMVVWFLCLATLSGAMGEPF